MPPKERLLRFDTSADQESHLFLVRIWMGPGNTHNEVGQWCGKVQGILSSKGEYFADWRALVDLIQSMLPLPDPNVGRPVEAQETFSTTDLDNPEKNPC